MKVSSVTNTSFKATVSNELMNEFNAQINRIKNNENLIMDFAKKLEQVPNWGEPNSEITICKGLKGGRTIGLKREVAPNVFVKLPIRNTNGSTLLSRFMNLKGYVIGDTEKAINNLLKKDGYAAFKRFL